MTALGLLLACVGIVILILIDIAHYERRERRANRMLWPEPDEHERGDQ